jgi:hypothetical protein
MKPPTTDQVGWPGAGGTDEPLDEHPLAQKNADSRGGRKRAFGSVYGIMRVLGLR